MDDDENTNVQDDTQGKPVMMPPAVPISLDLYGFPEDMIRPASFEAWQHWTPTIWRRC